MIRISVIIVNFNARYFLKNCISSVLSSDMVGNIEIIVVDNDSTDGSCDMLDKDFPSIQYIRNSKNVGFGKANNKGAKIARGEYILVLNPDTMLTETTLSGMLEFSERQNNFGAAGVRFIDGSGKYLPESKRNFPDLKVAGAKLLGYSGYYYANHIKQDEIAEVDILTGAFMFVKKKVYDNIGGFDEDFFMYGEDIDLSYRITKAGFKNFYVGNSKVLHFKGESTIKDKSYLENFYGALSIFHKKHFPNRAGLYGIVDSLISMMISLKSLIGPAISKPGSDTANWIYAGDDQKIFHLLKKKFPNSKGSLLTQIEKENLHWEVIFFDSKSIKFGEIVDEMHHSNFYPLRKRIIAQDHSFYLGSDSSNERGEVVQLQ